MAGSLNRATIIGNVGKDPDIKTMPSGKKIVNLSVATSESWTDKQSGEKKERTEWHRVVIFNEGLAGVAERYVRKGSKIMIEGQLQTRKWTDQNGTERYSTEIVLQAFGGNLLLLGDRGAADDAESHATQQRQPASASAPRAPQATPRATSGTPSAAAGGGYGAPGGDLDDEIPF